MHFVRSSDYLQELSYLLRSSAMQLPEVRLRLNWSCCYECEKEIAKITQHESQIHCLKEAIQHKINHFLLEALPLHSAAQHDGAFD